MDELERRRRPWLLLGLRVALWVAFTLWLLLAYGPTITRSY